MCCRWCDVISLCHIVSVCLVSLNVLSLLLICLWWNCFQFKSFAACFSILSQVIFTYTFADVISCSASGACEEKASPKQSKYPFLSFHHPFYLLLINGFMCFNLPFFVFGCFWASSKDYQGFQSKWQMLTRVVKGSIEHLQDWFDSSLLQVIIFQCKITFYLLISVYSFHSVQLKH